MIGRWLDSMILEAFSNPGDSMINLCSVCTLSYLRECFRDKIVKLFIVKLYAVIPMSFWFLPHMVF